MRIAISIVGCGAAFVITLAAAAGEKQASSEPALVELGRRLFFDPAIGREGRIGCASCHDPEHGFSDPRPVSQDETRTLPRHSQPLVDLAGEGFHWDGEFDSVREVIDARILPGSQPLAAAAKRTHRRVEDAVRASARIDPAAVLHVRAQFAAGGPYGDSDAAARCNMEEDVGLRRAAPPASSVAARIALGGRYDVGFRQAFGDAGVTTARVGDALEAYLGSLRSTTSDYDRFAAGGTAALTTSARRGLELFRGKANCSQCHLLDGTRAPFTDGKFHNTGVASQHDASGGEKDLGRLGTQLVEGRGAFKTPSLRDVARRGPWFHDASAATLEQAVLYYVRGGTPNSDLDPLLHPLGLSNDDVADLVAFLESLTSSERPGLGAAGGERASSISVRIEDLDGLGVAGRAVTIEPRGDRLAGTSEMPQPVTVFTDENGDVVAEMPASTHVVVKTTCTDESAMLPDWTACARFIVVPANKIAARVRFGPGPAERPASFVAHVGDLLSAGEPVRFVKVRDLGAESIYAAPAPRKELGPAGCVLVGLENAAGAKAAYVLDLRGGADNTIDLTAPLAADVQDAAVRDAARKEIDLALRLTRAVRPPKK